MVHQNETLPYAKPGDYSNNMDLTLVTSGTCLVPNILAFDGNQANRI